ncbi:hypothetical protein BABINDRAFT_162315 [Babjeviella inositovora NRRL Y-12698]|uniref:Maintenance of telomere capping protein 1 n=1 Tax=Babjeviella inositovora NRRL Y-12698 TaxID=984486 RepID=A0A1E3QQP6_9ASCO|nr:uncharacterized protein BABINDRAFT_162315 [Babjeviella inositovora NRRL Y-12698]ODQ79287.1 hypothetical protein BABINDRAFT_162315 [Babjeviella inositovora NRRL Y-12698]
MSAKKSSEADDVLDFLNSLPEKAAPGATPDTPKTGAKDEDLLGFLDELAAEDTKKKAQRSTTATPVPIAKEAVEVKETEPEHKQPTEVGPDETNQDDDDVIDLPDPIASISNWWSSGASTKVSSFWGSASAKAEEALKQLDLNAREEQLTQALHDVAQTTKASVNVDEAQKAMDSLSKNISLFGNRFTDVVMNTLVNGGVDPVEVLKISLVHDVKNYHYIDSLVARNFRRVMSQVEGGVSVHVSNSQPKADESSDEEQVRNLNIFTGKISDGEKLAFANLEDAIKHYKETKEDANPTKRSDMFITIQPISIPSSSTDEESLITIDSFSANSFAFTIILKDISHDITIITRSQPFPLKWAEWLDGSAVGSTEGEEKDGEAAASLQDVDPAEWVKEWIYDGLNLSFGVVAQSYVVKRMGF